MRLKKSLRVSEREVRAMGVGVGFLAEASLLKYLACRERFYERRVSDGDEGMSKGQMDRAYSIDTIG